MTGCGRPPRTRTTDPESAEQSRHSGELYSESARSYLSRTRQKLCVDVSSSTNMSAPGESSYMAECREQSWMRPDARLGAAFFYLLFFRERKVGGGGARIRTGV